MDMLFGTARWRLCTACFGPEPKSQLTGGISILRDPDACRVSRGAPSCHACTRGAAKIAARGGVFAGVCGSTATGAFDLGREGPAPAMPPQVYICITNGLASTCHHRMREGRRMGTRAQEGLGERVLQKSAKKTAVRREANHRCTS